MQTSIVTRKETEPLEDYPCVRIHRDGDIIVLFDAPESGTVLYSSYFLYKPGRYDRDWIEATDTSEWLPLEGTISFEK